MAALLMSYLLPIIFWGDHWLSSQRSTSGWSPLCCGTSCSVALAGRQQKQVLQVHTSPNTSQDLPAGEAEAGEEGQDIEICFSGSEEVAEVCSPWQALNFIPFESQRSMPPLTDPSKRLLRSFGNPFVSWHCLASIRMCSFSPHVFETYRSFLALSPALLPSFCSKSFLASSGVPISCFNSGQAAEVTKEVIFQEDQEQHRKTTQERHP